MSHSMSIWNFTVKFGSFLIRFYRARKFCVKLFELYLIKWLTNDMCFSNQHFVISFVFQFSIICPWHICWHPTPLIMQFIQIKVNDYLTVKFISVYFLFREYRPNEWAINEQCRVNFSVNIIFLRYKIDKKLNQRKHVCT